MGIHATEKTQLSARGILEKVRCVFNKILEPPRDSRWQKTKISLSDCLMSGLAVFGLKFPSLLQFDNSLDTEVIQHNLKTLYQVKEAPCDTTERTS